MSLTHICLFIWYLINVHAIIDMQMRLICIWWLILHTYTSTHPKASQCQCQTKLMHNIMIISILDGKCSVFLHNWAHCDKTKIVITLLLFKVMQIFKNKNISESVTNMKILSLYYLSLLHVQQKVSNHKSSKMIKIVVFKEYSCNN